MKFIAVKDTIYGAAHYAEGDTIDLTEQEFDRDENDNPIAPEDFACLEQPEEPKDETSKSVSKETPVGDSPPDDPPKDPKQEQTQEETPDGGVKEDKTPEAEPEDPQPDP